MSAVTIIPPAGIAGLAARIRAEHEAAQSAMRSVVIHAIEAGKLLMEAKALVGHGNWLVWLEENCGFSERTAQGYMRLARLDPTKAQRVADLSLREALKALAEAKGSPAAVSWSGEVEWHTPAEYVEVARQAMGRIDLDPASNEIAQEVVRAGEYFTEEENGLYRQWWGRVFLNPPYATGLIDSFVDKLLEEYFTGNVTEAVFLVHSRTDTGWFHRAMRSASAVCFTLGRISFQAPGREGGSPPIGSVFFYYGSCPVRARPRMK
jgi:hypothetical protein